MAGYPVLGLDLGQDRIHLPTDIHGHGAARLESAARRRFQRVRDVADERGGTHRSVRIGHRGRREQSLRVRMQRAGVELVAYCQFHDAAQIHHGHPAAEVLHDRQIVGDEKICQPERSAEVGHQVQYLSLDRGVQRGNGLVGDDEIRVQRQGAGDGHSLGLSARDLVREALRVVGVESH